MELNKISCIDAMEGIKEITDKSIDLILIDPPYSISRKSNYTNTRVKKYQSYKIDFGGWDKEMDFIKLFHQFSRILRDGGSVIVFYDFWKMMELKEAAEKANLHQARMGIWLKTNPVPVNSKRNYLTNSKEFFASFVKGNNPVFNSEYDKGVYECPICHGNERTSHPTQKPLSLIRELVRKHSNENEIVLDCFMGSGTTAIACRQLNRRFIGFENNKQYCEIALNRLVKYGQPLSAWLNT